MSLNWICYVIGLKEKANWEIVRLLGVYLVDVLNDEGFDVKRACAVVLV